METASPVLPSLVLKVKELTWATTVMTGYSQVTRKLMRL